MYEAPLSSDDEAASDGSGTGASESFPAGFELVPESPLGQLLRTPLPPERRPKDALRVDLDRHQGERRIQHFRSLLPDKLIHLVLDGGVPGSHTQVSVSERERLLLTALRGLAGDSDGASINGPKALLALLADMCAQEAIRMGTPFDVWSPMGPALVTLPHAQGWY